MGVFVFVFFPLDIITIYPASSDTNHIHFLTRWRVGRPPPSTEEWDIHGGRKCRLTQRSSGLVLPTTNNSFTSRHKGRSFQQLANFAKYV